MNEIVIVIVIAFAVVRILKYFKYEYMCSLLAMVISSGTFVYIFNVILDGFLKRCILI